MLRRGIHAASRRSDSVHGGGGSFRINRNYIGVANAQMKKTDMPKAIKLNNPANISQNLVLTIIHLSPHTNANKNGIDAKMIITPKSIHSPPSDGSYTPVSQALNIDAPI